MTTRAHRNRRAARAVMTAATVAAIGIAGVRIVGDDREHLAGPEPAGDVAPAGMTAEAIAVPTRKPRAANARDVAAPAPLAGVSALRSALSSPDVAVRIDAVEAAVAAGGVETLPVLESTDLKVDPDAAPTIIAAVAALGARAATADRARAASTLDTWLRGEARREGRDASGNVSVLVDALGTVGGREAAASLRRALDEYGLPLHVETLAVQNLAKLGDPGARDAITRFATRVSQLPAGDELDEELRQEALGAATDYLVP
jgi:hypothetical protein